LKKWIFVLTVYLVDQIFWKWIVDQIWDIRWSRDCEFVMSSLVYCWWNVAYYWLVMIW
jgi:hypothetical protein